MIACERRAGFGPGEGLAAEALVVGGGDVGVYTDESFAVIFEGVRARVKNEGAVFMGMGVRGVMKIEMVVV